MDPGSGFGASLPGVCVGAFGAAARWFSDIMQGRSRWVALHLLFIIVMGGFLGFMGAALAQASQRPEWSNVLSGVLGASGAFGFEFLIKRILGITRSD